MRPPEPARPPSWARFTQEDYDRVVAATEPAFGGKGKGRSWYHEMRSYRAVVDENRRLRDENRRLRAEQTELSEKVESLKVRRRTSSRRSTRLCPQRGP